MRILITGVPGTGKTVISKLLASEIGLKHINVSEFAIKMGFIIEVDFERKTNVADIEKLKEEIEKLDNIIIDSHFAEEFTKKDDFLIILITSPEELIKRLKKRSWPEKKVYENISSQFFQDYSEVNCDHINIINTTKRNPEEVVNLIKECLNEKIVNEEEDYSTWLEKNASKLIELGL